jgi:GAF domain-containing protein
VAACWSTPIMSSKGKVLGSFAMYYREPRTPNGEEKYLTDAVTKLAAQAIQHHAKREQPASGETTAAT